MGKLHNFLIVILDCFGVEGRRKKMVFFRNISLTGGPPLPSVHLGIQMSLWSTKIQEPPPPSPKSPKTDCIQRIFLEPEHQEMVRYNISLHFK